MGRTTSNTKSASDNDNKHHQGLQAVLLADVTKSSQQQNFRPLSLDHPKALSPLNNVVLLDYALEFLAGAGVVQVVVVCTNDQMEQHLNTSNNTVSDNMSVIVVKDSSLTNAGDALRELDKRNMIQSDPFVLLHGADIIPNVDLKAPLEQHKERHRNDTNCIMTVLLQRVGSIRKNGLYYSNIRSIQDDLIIGLDPLQQNRILVYDDHAQQSTVKIPCSFLQSQHSKVTLHTDLLDVGIDICSPEVLARFSDEFDYRDIRKEFVNYSVAEEEEGLQQKLFCYILKDNEYAARVHDFYSYHSISHNLLQRWCYPIVPDNLPSGYEREYRYAFNRHYLYREQKHPARVGRSSVIKGPGMLGSRCFVGEQCRIVKSVLGHNCHIEDGVVMEGCHLWGDNVIEKGAVVRDSILGKDSVVRAGAVVGKGCIIGSGCVIGTNVVLPEFTRITKAVETDGAEDEDVFGDFDESSEEEEEESGSEEEEEEEEERDTVEPPHEVGMAVSDHAVVGPDGIGRVWTPVVGDDDSDEDSVSQMDTLKAQSLGFDPSELYQKRLASQQEDADAFSDEEGEPLDDHADYGDDPQDSAFTFGETPSSTTNNLNEHGVLITGRQRGVDVVKELKAICLEHEMSSPIENLAIELNSFKFSQNASYSDCTMAAILTILENIGTEAGGGTTLTNAKLVTALKHQLEHWEPLLHKMSIGIDEEKSIIIGVETCATNGGIMGDTLSKEPAFRFVLQTLHDEEIVSEEAILAWAEERRQEQDADSPRAKLFQQQPTQDFLEWLAEESEEEEGDSDDEDSEDD